MAEQYTRKAIRNEFMHQLSQKPLNKITVTSIVANCHLNRNTFYYYYKDIYDLLKDILNEELEKLIAYSEEMNSWEDGFIEGLHIILDNRNVAYNLYRSEHKDLLHSYLFESAGIVIERTIATYPGAADAKPSDIELLTLFYQCALTELVEQWMETNMTLDGEAIIHRIARLLDKNLERSLLISTKLDE